MLAPALIAFAQLALAILLFWLVFALLRIAREARAATRPRQAPQAARRRPAAPALSQDR